MRIFGFIPSRYQSSRFPGKPLALVAGKPMVQHVYERAVSCPDFTEVYVATDDEGILACVRGFGGRAVMTQKRHRCGTDRISEAARKVGLKTEDLIVNIQGDQPLFNPEVISQLIRPLIEDASLSMVTIKYRIRDENEIGNPNHVKVVTDNEGYAIYFSRSPIPYFRDGEMMKTYYKHLGFYGYRMGFLVRFAGLEEGLLESVEKLEQLRALEHGYKIKVLETPFDSIEIDVPNDVEKVEKILQG